MRSTGNSNATGVGFGNGVKDLYLDAISEADEDDLAGMDDNKTVGKSSTKTANTIIAPQGIWSYAEPKKVVQPANIWDIGKKNTDSSIKSSSMGMGSIKSSVTIATPKSVTSE